MPATEAIILRKTPWKESCLLVVGLSPEHGRVDLRVRGGKRLGAKAFPAVDLFRVLEVEFRRADGGLQPLVRADLVRDHDRIVSRPENYLAACELAAFILRHAPPQLPAPRLYRALGHALQALGEPGTKSTEEDDGPGWPALVRLVFLDEHGLLDHGEHHESATAAERHRQRLLAGLLASAETGAPLPQATPAYWRRLREWVEATCRFHDLR